MSRKSGEKKPKLEELLKLWTSDNAMRICNKYPYEKLKAIAEKCERRRRDGIK